MKALLFAALAADFLVPLRAQDLAPELAAVAAKYKADLTALEAQKATAVARVQQQYFAALDGAEKTATTAGALDAVAAITKEREAVKSGLMTPAFPADLPKTLQMARKSYLDGVARVAADLIPRHKAVDADYLRALAALQTRAAANPELAKQIAAEKEKLLADTASGASAATSGGGSVNGRNVVVNGSFDTADADGHPGGWRLSGAAANAFKVIREGSNALLRVTVVGAPQSLQADQHIPVPPHAKTVLLRGRVRGKATEHNADDTNWGANIAARFRGADDQEVAGWQILNGGHDAGWKSLTKTFPVASGAKTLELLCIAQWVSGTFDFDDIEVEFR